MRHRRIARRLHAHAYRIKRAQREQRRQSRRLERGLAPAPRELPPLPDAAPPQTSPFPGGQAITQNEHRIAEDLHDWVLGGQDGIVNLLGTMLGVAVVTRNPTILIVTGLASAAAESLSMAAVAFTSMRASQSFYESERERQRQLIEDNPILQREILIDAYERRGLARHEATQIVTDFTKDKSVWLEMLMEEHLHLYSSERVKPWRSALIVGAASVIGSLIPVIPFFFTVGYQAIAWSLGLSAIVLFGGGALGAVVTIGDWRKRGLELVVIGMVAAIAGFGIGMLFTRVLGT